MTDFPDNFDSATRLLSIDGLGQTGQEAMRQLNDKGFEVHLGLTPELADRILAMSQEPSIREFCPRDSGERFTDRSATEHWLTKRRAVFLLFKKTDNGELNLAGYGWAGGARSSQVLGGQTTFAVRIGESGQGHGLAAPFSWLIVAGSAAVYGTRDYWLETWASNGAAVHIYHKIGFQTVSEKSDERPALSGERISDTRIYMSLPNERLFD